MDGNSNLHPVGQMLNKFYCGISLSMDVKKQQQQLQQAERKTWLHLKVRERGSGRGRTGGETLVGFAENISSVS